jgi:hypothetical protein
MIFNESLSIQLPSLFLSQVVAQFGSQDSMIQIPQLVKYYKVKASAAIYLAGAKA